MKTQAGRLQDVKISTPESKHRNHRKSPKIGISDLLMQFDFLFFMKL